MSSPTIFLNSMNDWKQEFTVGLLRPLNVKIEFTFSFDVCAEEDKGDTFTWFPIKDDPVFGLDVKLLSQFDVEEETQAVKDWVAENFMRIVNVHLAMTGDL